MDNRTPQVNSNRCYIDTNTMPTWPDAALLYAGLRWPVFPCRGKTPLTAHGYHDATTDDDTIRRWTRRYPHANVAIATGVAGLVIVDIDHAGLAAWRALVDQYGTPLELTAGVVTGGGGLHLYYRAPSMGRLHNTAGRLTPGIDTRAHGGYVIAPPSKHPTTGCRYQWMHGQTASNPLPAPIRERLIRSTVAEHPTARQSSFTRGGPIPDGQRNDTLFRLACSMRGRGMATADIVAESLAINRQRCHPPLDERVVERTALSAVKHPPEHRRPRVRMVHYD